ncbi:MAG: hypothetical protein PHE29_05105 [Tissierellia bacterium]|nr:hypothetical protein [Tissierellia bacterium]
MKNNIQNAGDSSLQIIGNRNLIFNFFRDKDCYKVLSNITKDIVDNLNGEIEMDIEKNPAEILEKIDYNNIPLHKNEFIDSIPYLSKIEYIVEKLYGKKSEIIINRIKYNWNKVCAIYSNESKDLQLYKLNDLLLKRIDSKIVKKYGLEYIEIGIGLIVFYVFTKCQILENPN